MLLKIIGLVSGLGITLRSAMDVIIFRDARKSFSSDIEASANSAGVSPHILSAVLWVESRFDPEAQGADGEIGMGQFKEIAARDVGTTQAALKGSATNQIDASAKLLALNKKRSGSMLTSIRAYNRGIGAAKSDPFDGVSYLRKVLQASITSILAGGLPSD